ncbi:MAG: prefoldin subunit alpha [Candidatus Micrarchaeia archaeon]
MSAEEDLNKMAIRAQLLQREGQALQGQIEAMETSINDLNATIDSIKNLKMAKEKGLLPIGSGTYITCKEVNADEVLVSIGSGLIMKKDSKDAIEILEKRQKEVADVFEKTQKKLMVINQELQDMNAQASVLAARMENVQPTQE